MKRTQALHDLGQSLWLDNITRTMLSDGTLARYIDELSVTGLTSNPTIFDKAITGGDAYDEQITELTEQGVDPEDIFFALALQDLQGAADLFRGVHEESDGEDGFVSMEVSPLLADDAPMTIEQAQKLHDQGARDNLFIKIPGTEAGCEAIEESIYAGIAINVTLLFSTDQYLAAAEAYMRGIERRIADGLDPGVRSVASLFMSRWDVAVADEVPDELRNRLGVAIGKHAYRAYRELLESDRFQKLAATGRSVNACCSPAPAPRTRTRPTSSTSRRWRRRTRSTRCPTRPSWPSRTMDRSAIRSRPTAGTPTRCWPSSRPRASTRTSSPPGFSGRARSPSTRAGTTSWNRSSRSPADWQPQGEQA